VTLNVSSCSSSSYQAKLSVGIKPKEVIGEL